MRFDIRALRHLRTLSRIRIRHTLDMFGKLHARIYIGHAAANKEKKSERMQLAVTYMCYALVDDADIGGCRSRFVWLDTNRVAILRS